MQFFQEQEGKKIMNPVENAIKTTKSRDEKTSLHRNATTSDTSLIWEALEKLVYFHHDAYVILPLVRWK